MVNNTSWPYAGPFNGLLATIPSYQVTHIRLASTGFGQQTPGYEHIVALKGPGFVKSREQVVAEIDRGLATYYTNQAPLAPRAFLEVRQHGLGLLGARHVRTQPDCTPLNNLLNLPRF